MSGYGDCVMRQNSDDHRCWISVIGEAEGLRWILAHNRMAWTVASSRRAALLAPGDDLVLYVSRNAFHNPSRDESQLVALATAHTELKRLKQPMALAGREFITTTGVRFSLQLPEREGVAIKPLVPHLSFVRRPEVWGMYFRSGLIEIPEDDFSILKDAIRESHRKHSAREARSSPPSGVA